VAGQPRVPTFLTPLGAYWLLAYALTWVFTIPFVYVWHNVTDQHFAWWMILFLPGAYGPTLAAILVTAATAGPAGVRTLLGKFCNWRAPVGWWLFVAATPLVVVFVAIVVTGFGPQAAANLDLGRAPLVVAVALLVALPFGPLPEEPGWRGYALPSLLARHGILASSLVVGFFWTFWHIPMFWFPGAAIPSCLQLSLASVLVFLLLLCAQSITFTVVYLQTRGSVPVAITLHLFGNAATNIAYGLTTQPSVDQAQRVYYATVVLHGIVAAVMLGYNAFVPAARDGTNAARDSAMEG
jgi:uncharacterized protein